MNPKIKLLGLFQEESLAMRIQEMVKEYPELTFIQARDHQPTTLAEQQYDILLTDHSLTPVIAGAVSYPVISIVPSQYDLLRSLQLAKQSHQPFVLLGSNAIIEQAKILCDLLKYMIPFYPLSQAQSPLDSLGKIKADHFHTVICEGLAYDGAKSLRLNPILLAPGHQTLKNAIDQAIKAHHQVEKQTRLVHILSTIVKNDQQIVVLDTDHNVLYSSIIGPDQASILSILTSKIKAQAFQKNKTLSLTVHTIPYQVTKACFEISSETFFVFTLTTTHLSNLYLKNGIKTITQSIAEKNFINSFYSYTSEGKKYTHFVQANTDPSMPIILAGEIGSQKDLIAEQLYANSQRAMTPLYVIDCSMMTKSGLAFIFSHENSPLFSVNHTLYFSNINLLCDADFKKLLALIKRSDFRKANTFIFSVGYFHNEKMPHLAMQLANTFNGNIIRLKPLCDQTADLTASATLYLDHLNQKFNKELIGFEPEALAQLKAFSWPYNFSQYERVLREAALKTKGFYIQAKTIAKILALEKGIETSNETADKKAIDLSLPLKNIIKQVSERVLEDCDNNQTAAAKQLGISRTTLWKYFSVK